MIKLQSKLIWGALIGSTISAAAILLLTPSSGQKLRNKLQNYLHRPVRNKHSRHNVVHKYVRKAKRAAARKKHT